MKKSLLFSALCLIALSALPAEAERIWDSELKRFLTDQEMTMAEVAVAVGSNVNTVSSRVKAARRQFEAAVRRLRAKDDWRGR